MRTRPRADISRPGIFQIVMIPLGALFIATSPAAGSTVRIQNNQGEVLRVEYTDLQGTPQQAEHAIDALVVYSAADGTKVFVRSASSGSLLKTVEASPRSKDVTFTVSSRKQGRPDKDGVVQQRSAEAISYVGLSFKNESDQDLNLEFARDGKLDMVQALPRGEKVQYGSIPAGTVVQVFEIRDFSRAVRSVNVSPELEGTTTIIGRRPAPQPVQAKPTSARSRRIATAPRGKRERITCRIENCTRQPIWVHVFYDNQETMNQLLPAGERYTYPDVKNGSVAVFYRAARPGGIVSQMRITEEVHDRTLRIRAQAPAPRTARPASPAGGHGPASTGGGASTASPSSDAPRLDPGTEAELRAGMARDAVNYVVFGTDPGPGLWDKAEKLFGN